MPANDYSLIVFGGMTTFVLLILWFWVAGLERRLSVLETKHEELEDISNAS